MLTPRSIAALEARATRYAVPDAKVSGLELRIHTDGTKRWSLRYRVSGEQRRLKLGLYPRLSLADARELASKELRKIDGGIDPQQERQAARAATEQAKADSIEALCAAFIERHAKPRKRTWRDDHSKLQREVLPHWKRRAVTSITRRDCRQLVQSIADRGAPILANRVAALLSRLFRFALDEEVIANMRHALRNTVATGLAECGVHESDIAKVLNHTYGPRVTRGYNEYGYDREKRVALEAWARRLTAIIEQKDDRKVLPFAQAT